MAKLSPRKSGPVDTSKLAPEDILAVKAKAKKEFEEKQKADSMAALLEEEKERLARAADPDEELIFIQVSLPDYAADIRIDGLIYPHGWHGSVARTRVLSMQDAIARAWDHEHDTQGKRFPNRRPLRELTLSGMDAGSASRSLLERRI